jgi:hypothetical protein
VLAYIDKLAIGGLEFSLDIIYTKLLSSDCFGDTLDYYDLA